MKYVAVLSLLFVACGCPRPRFDSEDFMINPLRAAVRANIGDHCGGSGVIIDNRKDTYILTAAHVVFDGDSVRAGMTFDGEPFVVAAHDKQKDLALVRLKKKAANRPWAPFSSVYPKKAEEVFLVGCPGGMPKQVSRGVLSNVIDIGGVQMYMTDADCTYGSSGGGMFNKHGQLIGITSTMYVYGGNKWTSCNAISLGEIRGFLKEIRWDGP